MRPAVELERRPRAVSTANFPHYPPPEGKTWYTTTEGVTIAISPAQRELALRNLAEQGLPLPQQFDDEPLAGGGADDGYDPESPGRGDGYGELQGGEDGGEGAERDDKRRRGCCRCSRGAPAGSGALPGAEEPGAVRPGCWGNLAAVLSLLNPIAATGCAGLCLSDPSSSPPPPAGRSDPKRCAGRRRRAC